MAAKPLRASGHRQVGGLYLVGHKILGPCDRLPYPLELRPITLESLPQPWTPRRINALRLFGDHKDCHCPPGCPVCRPDDGPHYLLGVSSRHYTAEAFCFEAQIYGVSIHIQAVPPELQLGVSWVYLSHRHACITPASRRHFRWAAGVFTAFKPAWVDLLVWQSECTEELVERYKGSGVAVISIPDGDLDHAPRRTGGNR